MKRMVWFVFALTGLLGGCAHIMSEAGLAAVDRSISYADISKNPEALAGKKVLVGGIIAETRSSGDVIQLEVAQLELYSNGVPNESSRSGGRFLVVSGELLDPVFYHPGTFITVIGEIKGQRIQKLGGADYRYPLISAKEIHLLRESDSSLDRPANPYRNEVGDGKFLLRPPGSLEGEPRKP
ncbi:MAG: Slp family lipoprotein [Desulfuromonadaceae bacterium]